MSMSHILILIIIAVIVVPPDKLPDFARQIARFVNDLRRSTSGVWDDIKKDAMLKPEDLLKRDNVTAPGIKDENTNNNVEAAETKTEMKKHES